MGVTQLDVYNRALIAMGERRLASTSELREPRRVLDDLWTDVQQYCLEQGMWNFALRNTSLAPTGSAGYMNFTNYFTKPTDFVHLFTASGSSTYDPPFMGTDFIDQGGFWYSNAPNLYIRYSSNDAAYGTNLALWTQCFATYVVHVLASWAAVRITGSEALAEALEARASRYLLAALAIDSVPQLPGLRPFNAEARAKPIDEFQPQPIDMRPFYALLASMGAPPQGQPPGGGR